MTVINDNSLFHLNIGLAGNQTECFLIVVLLIIVYPVSGATTKVYKWLQTLSLIYT